MRCVKCNEPIARLDEPCPHCQFHGDPARVEELSHVKWLLEQTDALKKLGIANPRLTTFYRARQRELEILLGLRPRALSSDRARDLSAALAQQDALLRRIDGWLAAGLINRDAIQPILAETRAQVRDLQWQLEGHARPTYPRTPDERLAIVEFLLSAARTIGARSGFASADAEARAHTTLLAEQGQLEIKLGLRKPPPAPTPPEQLAPPREPIAGPAPPSTAAQCAPPPPRAPQPPLRERFWSTLLSERTLQAMLFLGIFLLFAAAISFVFWGWKDFPPLLRVAIPTLFTFIFLALGWYVRTQTRMYRSGIALTAIAALLIPIDFYTLYVNFNIPPEHTPLFGFITSLVCLAAYSTIALLTQSWLFGYLVGAAAGGTVLSLVEIGHQHFALARDWDAAALAHLAVALLLIAAALSRAQPNRWRVLAEPFRNLALIAAGEIMLLSFGGRYLDRKTFDALHYSMTISWWLGGLAFGWGAIHYRSRTLGILAALALPVATFFAQAALFDHAQINPAWHAFGLALLVPIYLTVGNRLLAYRDDQVLRGHGRTATGWGIALTVIAALWSPTNLTSSAAAASSHAVLFGAMLLALFLWRQPRILYAAALFALTMTAFTMSELNLSPKHFAIGWSSWALACIVIAFWLGNSSAKNANPGACVPVRASVARMRRSAQNDIIREDSRHSRINWRARLIATLINAGFIIAALAILPTLLPYDGSLLAYALGNWLALAAWSARLAHAVQPGFAPSGWLARSRFHWMTALPLPVWIWVLFANRGPLGYDLPLAQSALAWGMVALSVSLRAIVAKQSPPRDVGIASSRSFDFTAKNAAPLRTLLATTRTALTSDLPWYVVGLFVSVAAPIAAFFIARNGYTPALALLSAGSLYIADAITNRHRWELVPGAWVTAWGWAWLLNRAGMSFDQVTLAAALLVAIFIFAGLGQEHRRSRAFTRDFLMPLYWASHTLAFVVLLRVAIQPIGLRFSSDWTDANRVWEAASCLSLGVVYACYAWGRFKERWAHAAAWLFVAGGGLVSISYSAGTGSLAARAALGAIAFVLGERALFALRRYANLREHLRAFFHLAWRLYRRPLLIAGWITSVAVIGIALVRNLILLGGGRTQQIWSVVGLTMIVALYALSARLFRQARFVWLAAFLAFIPWTIMTNLGWLVANRPALASFALSWIVLAALLYLIGMILQIAAPRAYALPPRVVAHLFVPFALVWGIAHAETSRWTFGLAIVFYAIEAARQHRRSQVTPIARIWDTRFLYPALGLVPIWCVDLLNLLPGARHEHYGLMLLPFGILGLLAGQWLRRVAPRAELAQGYALPAYLTGYVATIVGTLLVAHEPGLLALALLYDALLMLGSARLFKNPLWVFAAAAIAPFALWLALNQSGMPGNRHGWWLIGLAAVYLLTAWMLRHARLAPSSTAPLTIAFALIAFALPPSSQDKVGAFWGYGGAAILYAVAAFWLRQALLLTPASALVLVPYAVGLQESALSPEYYGIALFPGALIALAIGRGLDARFGAWRDFPWHAPARWLSALAERLVNWWALPLYALGFGLVAASPFCTNGKPGLAALNWLLAMPIGAWAVYRFRLRIWLFATALAGHFAAYLYLYDWGWRRYPSDFALRFVPITATTIGIALVIERWRKEMPPIYAHRRLFDGWSHPLYLLAAFDLYIVQMLGLTSTQAGAAVSLTHAILLAVLASFWLSRWMPYVTTALGLTALVQYMTTQPGALVNAPTPLAQLALGYGLIGYGLAYLRERRGITAWLAIWDPSLRRSGIVLSFAVLALAAILGVNLAQWTVRALFGFSFRRIVDLPTVQMVVSVLALLGLLYLAAAFIHRRLRVGYAAIAMLIVAWMLHAFYVQQWDGASHVQWYALPAGVYLLGVSFLEWQRGSKNLARWIDYAAVVLMMGSLFWQTLLYGWSFALMLGAEGFAAFWWGSARRLRRFLYAGMMGVVLAVLAQLINSLQSINQWLVFGIIGLLVVVAAIMIERRIEDVKALRQMIETWE